MKNSVLTLVLGFLLAAGAAQAGPTPGGVDTDGDTVENPFDNCSLLANASQVDTDHNGCGDACTEPLCDFNGDLCGGAPDLLILGMNWGMAVPPGTAGDCDGDGVVGAPDFLVFGTRWGNCVGPSGITSALCDPATCICIPQ